MPSVITHALAGAALGAATGPKEMRVRFAGLAAVCSVLPDADVIGFRLGIEYGDLLGHRGLSHSIFFAAVVSAAVVLTAFRKLPNFGRRWCPLWLCFFLILAAHGLLDAMTLGGLGIALLSPFDTTRYFLPWRVIRVAPIISIGYFFGEHGVRALVSEIMYVWIPTILVGGTIWIMRTNKANAPDRVSCKENNHDKP